MEFTTFDTIAFSTMSKYAQLDKREIKMLSGKGVDRKEAIVKYLIDSVCATPDLCTKFSSEVRSLATFCPKMITKNQILQMVSASFENVVSDRIANIAIGGKTIDVLADADLDLSHQYRDLFLTDVYSSLLDKLYKGTEFMTTVLSTYLDGTKYTISYSLAKSFMENGADPTVEDGGIFMKLCKYADAPTIQYVLDNYDMNINCRNNSPLMMAAKFNGADIVEYLVNCGAEPGVKRGIIAKTLEKRRNDPKDTTFYFGLRKGAVDEWLNKYLHSLKEKI